MLHVSKKQCSLWGQWEVIRSSSETPLSWIQQSSATADSTSKTPGAPPMNQWNSYWSVVVSRIGLTFHFKSLRHLAEATSFASADDSDTASTASIFGGQKKWNWLTCGLWCKCLLVESRGLGVSMRLLGGHKWHWQLCMDWLAGIDIQTCFWRASIDIKRCWHRYARHGKSQI